MAFATPDASIVRTWGETLVFRPVAESPDEFEVLMVRDDQAIVPDDAPAALLVYFGTRAASGFADLAAPTPVKNDIFEVEGEDYRVFQTKLDPGGGTADTRGLWVFLDKVEA